MWNVNIVSMVEEGLFKSICDVHIIVIFQLCNMWMLNIYCNAAPMFGGNCRDIEGTRFKVL